MYRKCLPFKLESDYDKNFHIINVAADFVTKKAILLHHQRNVVLLTPPTLVMKLINLLKKLAVLVTKSHINLLSATPTKWSNTLKQFVGC